MKKFTKISLIVAAVMMGLGILLCGIASVYGAGFGTLCRMANEGIFDWGNWHIRPSGIYYSTDDVDDMEYWDDMEHWEEKESADGTDVSVDSTAIYDSASVKNICFEIGAARVIVNESEDVDKITVDLYHGNEKYFDSTLEGDTLTITYDKRNVVQFHGKDTIVVSVPRASAFDELQFLLGAAAVEMDDTEITCRELLVDIGAASMEVEQLTVLETAEISVDAGEIVLEDSRFRDVNFACAVGNIKFSGSVDGNLTGNCEMGNIEIDLTGRERDYNYDLSCEMGELTINGERYAGIDREYYDGRDGAKGTIRLTCEMGSIELETE